MFKTQVQQQTEGEMFDCQVLSRGAAELTIAQKKRGWEARLFW